MKIDLKSPSAILINEDTGKILYEKNAHIQRNPASTTKIATGLFFLEKKGNSLDEMATVTQEAVGVVNASVRQRNFSMYPSYRLEHDGISFGLKAREKVPLKTLFYALMINSANDAANVIAEHLSGDINVFMEQLNQFLHENGIKNTKFYNPHGLLHPDHKSTAYDMAKMAQLALKNPIFRNVVKIPSYQKLDANGQPVTTYVNNNRLLRPGKYYYPKATGIKTGYIMSAGYNVVASAEQDGRRLIAVIMGAATSEERFKDVVALFEKGFSEAKVSRKLFTKDYDVFSEAIEGAEGPLKAKLGEDLFLTYFPSEEPDFQVSISWERQSLPIKQGEEVGLVVVKSSEGQILLKKPIFSDITLEGTLSYRFKRQIDVFWNQYKTLVGALILINGIAIGLYFLMQKRKTSN